MPLKSQPMYIILGWFFFANPYADVFFVIDYDLDIDLIHTTPFKMVDPTKLLKGLLIVLLKQSLLDVLVKIDLLDVLEFEDCQFHDIDGHETFDHLLI